MQLGAKAGIDGHWISNIECGKVNPVWGNLRRIASGLGVTLEHLTSLTRTYELNQAIGLAVSSIRAEQGLGRRKVATRAGLTTRELEVIENGRGPLVSQQLEGRLRRGLRVQKERWFKALEAAKLQLGVS